MVSSFESKFGQLVLRWRWLIIIATLAIVTLAASGGQYLTFTTNYRVFFSPDNPQLLAFEALENTYNKSDNVMYVLTPKEGRTIFEGNRLAAVEWLTKEAWQTPHSTRVDSITNFQHTEAADDELVVRDLIKDASNLDDPAIAKARSIALAEPILVRQLVAPGGDVSAVNVTVQLPGIDETKETPEVVIFSRALAERFVTQFPEFDVHLPGMVMMNNAFSESSQNDMKTLVPLSFAVMLIFLMLLLKGFSGTFVTLLVILFSIVSAMGIGGWLGVPLTPPSASAPTIILTIAIANCVHVLVTFLQHYGAREEKANAISESLRINITPVFIASLTTALGFLSMNFSEVPPFQHLGNLVALGVAFAFVLSVTFLPALLSFLPVKVRETNVGRDELMARFGEFVVKRRTPLLWGMVVLAVLLVASLPRNELNDVFVNYFDESVAFRKDSDYTTERLTGLYRMEYSLESGEPGGVSDPAFLKDVKAFADWYRAQPETIHVNVLTDVMTRLNKNMHNDEQKWYRLPDERDLSAQYLLLYEMSLPYGLDLNNQINVDKSATRLVVTLKTLSSNGVLELEERAGAWLRKNATHLASADASGTTLMFAHIGRRNIESMLLGTTVALVAISILLMLALRSVKVGIVSLLPNLIPGAMGFGLWGLLVGEVGLALSVVTGMTLGIVVDDTVHFLSKYLRARRELGYDAKDAVRYAFTTVGRALVVTSIVLIAGFLVLSTSSFELNSGMGILTAIVIGFALLADFLLLPPLLMKLEESNNESSRVAGAVADGASV